MSVTLERRPLGRNGPVVAQLGLGCMPMSGTYGPADDDAAIATIQRALDLGITMIDTADTYGRGHNEGLVGRALAGRRERAFLATKFGRIRTKDEPNGFNGRPEYVRSACDASLARLGVETIDLYYLHRVDPKTPIEETIGAMAGLVQAGKVRYLGISEASAENIRRAAAVHPIAALQSEYSLFTRDVEDNGALATIRELGIALVPYSPLGRGMLAGEVTPADFLAGDSRLRHPRFQGENFAKNLAVVEAVRTIARELDATAAQVAIAWVIAQGSDVFPIPGTKRVRYLEENVAAAGIALTSAHLQRIEAVAPKGVAAGPRTSG